jgi:hypothetical protein
MYYGAPITLSKTTTVEAAIFTGSRQCSEVLRSEFVLESPRIWGCSL